MWRLVFCMQARTKRQAPSAPVDEGLCPCSGCRCCFCGQPQRRGTRKDAIRPTLARGTKTKLPPCWPCNYFNRVSKGLASTVAWLWPHRASCQFSDHHPNPHLPCNKASLVERCPRFVSTRKRRFQATCRCFDRECGGSLNCHLPR